MNGQAQKKKNGKIGFVKKVEKKEAVYQLKKTSDYSQIHPPGPEQNLKKKKNGNF